MVTKEQANAAKDALNINESGCNGKAIARALVRACDAWKDTDESNTSPPVKLIIHQFCHLSRIFPGISLDHYLEAIRKCEQIIKEYEEQGKEATGTFSTTG